MIRFLLKELMKQRLGALMLLLVMMLTMTAQTAWAEDVVTYTISHRTEDGRLIYYFNGSDGSSQVVYDTKSAKPTSVTLEMGSDVTFNITAKDGRVFTCDNTTKAEDISMFGFSDYFNTNYYAFTFTSKSRNISHIQIDGENHIITEPGTAKNMSYVDVACSKGFRYVRYVGPADMRCNIGELEFYGHPGEGDESHLYRLTNLPTVSIHTANNVEPYDKVHNIDALITIISDSEKKLRTDSGSVRLRGNRSTSFPKKPYRIKYDKKHRVLDAPAKAKKWTLINNYGDKTLMRNLLAFELSRGMGMPYTPFGQSVDLLLNGEYKGNYQLCDHIDVKEGRVELVDTLAEGSEDSSSTAFLIEADARAATEDCWFTSKKGTPMAIHYPDDDEITPEQKAYIEDCFNSMEEDWKSRLDLNTFIRHFLVGELSGNTDNYWSTYMYKHRENDTIFIYPTNAKSDFLYRSGGSSTGNMRTFVDDIIVRDRDARAKLLEIWSQARNGSIK